MRFARFTCLLVLFALCRLGSAEAAISVTDARGEPVTLEAPATRIVALAPHAVELLYAVGAGEALSGVIAGSDYPPAAQALPRVGSYQGISLEAILSRRPDLVVSWLSGTPHAVTARLRGLGIPVYASEPRHLSDIPEELRELGRLTGHADRGEARAERFAARLAELRQHFARPPRVFYQVASAPLTTLGDGQIITQVIRACGGQPLFADSPVLVPQVSREALLAARPTVILAAGDDDAWQAAWQRWTTLPAVRDGHLYTLDPDEISRPGPRLLEGMAQVCRVLAEAATAQ